MFKIRYLRHLYHISQQQLAEQLFFSRSAIRMWEQGLREPSLETIKKIATFFNVSLDYLLDMPPISYDAAQLKYHHLVNQVRNYCYYYCAELDLK